MTQYLIKKTTHDTGEIFHDVIKAKENEVFTLVDAESEKEAKLLADDNTVVVFGEGIKTILTKED